MKTHTANYKNTFIAVADDCPVPGGEVPPVKGDTKTVANLQYDLIRNNPYRFTSDDVLFHVFSKRNDLTDAELEQAREQFFSKGQPCLRACPLTKKYGWGIHSNEEGKVAMFGSETAEYQNFVKDKSLVVLKAMRSAK